MKTIYTYIRQYILTIIAWLKEFDGQDTTPDYTTKRKQKRKNFLTESEIYDIEQIIIAGLPINHTTRRHLAERYDISLTAARHIVLGIHHYSSQEYISYLESKSSH